jgi:hypothetical protein
MNPTSSSGPDEGLTELLIPLPEVIDTQPTLRVVPTFVDKPCRECGTNITTETSDGVDGGYQVDAQWFDPELSRLTGKTEISDLRWWVCRPCVEPTYRPAPPEGDPEMTTAPNPDSPAHEVRITWAEPRTIDGSPRHSITVPSTPTQAPAKARYEATEGRAAAAEVLIDGTPTVAYAGERQIDLQWAHPDTGETATVGLYPPRLEPDTWCVSFKHADGSPNGGANLDAAYVARTMEIKGFEPASTTAHAGTRAFPTAADAVDRPSLAKPAPAPKAAPAPAKTLRPKR